MVPFARRRHTLCVVVVVPDGKVASRAVGVGDGAAEAGGGVLDVVSGRKGKAGRMMEKLRERDKVSKGEGKKRASTF